MSLFPPVIRCPFGAYNTSRILFSAECMSCAYCLRFHAPPPLPFLSGPPGHRAAHLQPTERTYVLKHLDPTNETWDWHLQGHISDVQLTEASGMSPQDGYVGASGT